MPQSRVPYLKVAQRSAYVALVDQVVDDTVCGLNFSVAHRADSSKVECVRIVVGPIASQINVQVALK